MKVNLENIRVSALGQRSQVFIMCTELKCRTYVIY